MAAEGVAVVVLEVCQGRKNELKGGAGAGVGEGGVGRGKGWLLLGGRKRANKLDETPTAAVP